MRLHSYEKLTKIIGEKLDDLDRSPADFDDRIDVDSTTIHRNLYGDTKAPYHRLKQILDILNEWEDNQSQPAQELMTVESNITYAYLNDTRYEAAEKMREDQLSQLPVKNSDDGLVVGIVTDSDLMKEHNDETPIADIDYNEAIRVEPDTSRRLVEQILDEGYYTVLVAEDGELRGMITKYDLLERGPNLGSLDQESGSVGE
jgi:predicted transcriptional regulator